MVSLQGRKEETFFSSGSCVLGRKPVLDIRGGPREPGERTVRGGKVSGLRCGKTWDCLLVRHFPATLI